MKARTFTTVAAALAISGFALVGFGCESTSESDSDHMATHSEHSDGDHPNGEHPEHPNGEHPEHPEGDHPSGDHPDHPE